MVTAAARKEKTCQIMVRETIDGTDTIGQMTVPIFWGPKEGLVVTGTKHTESSNNGQVGTYRAVVFEDVTIYAITHLATGWSFSLNADPRCVNRAETIRRAQDLLEFARERGFSWAEKKTPAEVQGLPPEQREILVEMLVRWRQDNNNEQERRDQIRKRKRGWK